MVQTSNLLFPGPGKSKMVQTSNLLFPGFRLPICFFAGREKAKGFRLPICFFPVREKAKWSRLPICFFLGREKAKWFRLPICFFPGRDKAKCIRLPSWKATCGTDFQLLAPACKQTMSAGEARSSPQPSAYESGALSIRPQLAGKKRFLQAHERQTGFAFPGSSFQFAFSRAGKKQNGSDFQFAFSQPRKKQNGSDFQFAFSRAWKNQRTTLMLHPENRALESPTVLYAITAVEPTTSPHIPALAPAAGVSSACFQLSSFASAMQTFRHTCAVSHDKEFSKGREKAHGNVSDFQFAVSRQASNLLFPGPAKSKMVQTSNLLFPVPGKSKRLRLPIC